MAEFVLKNAGGRYATVEGSVLKWEASHAEASGFPDKETALAAFEAAAQAVRDAGRKKLEKSLAKGLKIKPKWSWEKERDPVLADYLPMWAGMAPKVEPRATESDLMGAFEIYFVKSKSGWLGPERGSGRRGFAWHQDFSRAAPFLSEESAQAAFRSTWGQNACVIRSSCLASGVKAFDKAADGTLSAGEIPSDDGVSQAIAAACESRDIASEVERLGRESMDTQARPRKPGPKKMGL